MSACVYSLYWTWCSPDCLGRWYSGFMQFYIALSVLGTLVVFPTGPDIGLNDK